jgi:dinuclear metal center YbgI/SA1388 family protein
VFLAEPQACQDLPERSWKVAELEQILCFLDETFQPSTYPDYSNALNGLQVEGRSTVLRLGAAVDACEQTILAAVEREIDLLLVHHGLFWGGLGPITGPRLRKLTAIIKGGMSLYSLHLPLDSHPELGNNAVLVQEMDFVPSGAFGSFQEIKLGWWAEVDLHREDLAGRLKDAVDSDVRLIPGGPERVRRVGIVSGGGAFLIGEAAASGIDTLVTGEAPHHAYHEALELGVNLILGGHYATETLGVKALAALLSEKFTLPWEFLDFPTGL